MPMTKTSTSYEHPIACTQVTHKLVCGAPYALLAATVLLCVVGCKPAITEPPAPRLEPVIQSGVPSAASVVSAETVAPNAYATAGRSNSSLTRAQESSGMPLPGQNNDHSAPVAPTSSAKRP